MLRGTAPGGEFLQIREKRPPKAPKNSKKTHTKGSNKARLHVSTYGFLLSYGHSLDQRSIA